jgi:hypothetical protein
MDAQQARTKAARTSQVQGAVPAFFAYAIGDMCDVLLLAPGAASVPLLQVLLRLGSLSPCSSTREMQSVCRARSETRVGNKDKAQITSYGVEVVSLTILCNIIQHHVG